MVHILIAGVEAPQRGALSDLVSVEDGLELAGVASDADGAADLARTMLPAVALLALRMPGGGAHAAREVATASPGTRIVAFGDTADTALLNEMVGAGAIGFLPDGAGREEVVEAIVRAARNQSSFPGEIARSLVSRPNGERAALVRLASAAEDERRRIAANIHDDSIQVMTAAGMRLQILRKALDSPDQIRRLEEVEQTIHLSIARLRRLIFELRPASLDLEGLGASLRLYAEGASAESGASCEVTDLLADEPPEEIRVILYRIGQEVLSNVRKHASATHVNVTLATSGGGYLITIADDGNGFAARDDGILPGAGLATARERAELLGGRVDVASAPGAGTTVEYWLPGNGA